jgi:hypothetical protein
VPDNASPECNLTVSCAYYMGEIAMSIKKTGVPNILDGDMLTQFLELTSMQQEAVLLFPLGSRDAVSSSMKSSSSPLPINQVVQLLERVHYALN